MDDTPIALRTLLLSIEGSELQATKESDFGHSDVLCFHPTGWSLVLFTLRSLTWIDYYLERCGEEPDRLIERKEGGQPLSGVIAPVPQLPLSQKKESLSSSFLRPLFLPRLFTFGLPVLPTVIFILSFLSHNN